MPRAVDPSLVGQQLPIGHSPLNRIGVNVRKPDFDIGDIEAGFETFIRDYLCPAIESVTGIDMSGLLDILDLLSLDFSSPAAFITSVVNAIVALPEVVALLLTTALDQIGNFPELVNNLLSAIVDVIVSLPDIMATLLTSIVSIITNVTGVDLSAFLPLWQDLDFSNPIAFFISLAEALLATGAGLLGIDSPLNSLNLFNLVPTTLLGQIDISHIGQSLTNLLTDPNFLDAPALAGITGWIHDLTGGFGGLGAMFTTANGTVKELLGNLIPVSEGQQVPISGKAKWTGLIGTGNPIALGITGYLNGSPTVQSTIASHNTTPTTTDWLTLSGTYNVPANVDAIRTRLIVGNTATAGQVGFSSMSVTKIGPMLQRLIAGTNPGEFLPQDITHLFNGIVSNATELLNKAGLGDFNNLLATIGGTFGNDLAAAEQRLDDFLHSLSPLDGSHINTGNIADDFIPGIGQVVTNIFNGLFGQSSSSASHFDAFSALQANAHALTDHGAGITNMFARLSNLESTVAALPVASGGKGAGTAAGGLVGVQDTDNFERTSSTSLGSNWIQDYSGGAGTWAIPNGHDASFATSGIGDREFLCIRNLSSILRSQTDYQRVTIELSSKASRFYDALLGTYNFCGHDDIWLRISDSTTSLANITGIRIRYGGDGSLSITQFVTGTGTLLASLGVGGIVPPGPGANLIGEAGVLADSAPLVIRAKIGASIRLSANSTLTVGTTRRRWGHGGRAEGHLLPLPGQETPGGLHYFNAMDQTL